MTLTTNRHVKTIATVCLSGTLDDKLVAAAHAGFDGIELFEPDLVASTSSPKQIRERCAELGLQIVLYQPFRDLDSTDPEQFERNLNRLDRKFDVMTELGVDLILVCSNASADAVADMDELATQLRAAGELADRRGMRIAYEALAWGRTVDLWQQSWDAVRRADHPAVGLCLDSFHILSRSSTIDELGEVPSDKIFFLQLADAPHKDMDVLQWSRHYRLFPGEGAFDLVDFTAAVLGAGYRGPLSLEVFNDVFRQSSPVRTAIDAVRSLGALEAGLDDALPRQRFDAAFVELSVTPTNLTTAEHALSALGFRQSATHRSKRVTAWTQSSATILLTVTTDAAEDDSSALAAIAFDAEDPTGFAASAEGLNVSALPRVVRPGEADLPAVAAPDGVSIFFVSTEEGPLDWRRDFEPVPPTDAASGVGITAIDHVSVTAPFDRYDESVLFYRSVLGMRTEEVAEYPGPYGLVRSHLLRAPEPSGFGVALDGPLLRRGKWTPGVQTPQHIALLTDDVLATLDALPGDAPILRIPENYYVDLRARLDLDDEFVERLRRSNVLYDRSPDGEYLHAYTTVIGSQVYFEIIERRGNYRGRPLADAPIRMAAHVAARRGRTEK
ncbi:sugar phosphate isomerase/epimerase and 4-hydroxyphenylpyruvate domain-containing protein [Mycolicibacterium arabiense]|uniref:sugar phosphate isomerase/epimerase and 4-hydroxyphenylpyruvate domain-containing protein n=1 Tax=Mycolicibacterium arabiense TaxID=1286181 RepID=UPI0013D3A754|nr:sugar phosphate isomerase/epimerase and 4-hydroxyphenylpyruvate domain-containing protein [Mycolicibacterium arabiense]MCV7376333.1 sugar phosphate isomerase/epimerase and 4-hydroxyphenylpyruvate domain-containing protein [Mycolicibacterium arabiense]